MRVSHIAPTNLLGKYSTHTKYHLALAHIARADDEYVEYFRLQRDAEAFVILDNGTYETGQPMDRAMLGLVAERMRPDEVVLPDYLSAGVKTYRAIQRWIKSWREEFPDIKLMAVPQSSGNAGKQLADWIYWHDSIVREFHPDTIGIPKVLDRNRPKAVEALNARYHGMEQPIAYHLLGTIDSDPMEVTRYGHMRWIRGIDSKLPIRAGVNGVSLPLKINRECIPQLDLHYEPDDYPDVTRANCGIYEAWAS